MDGARWVQEEILDKNPSLQMDVYAIWFSMLPGDTPAAFPGAQRMMPDRRVVHLWDTHRLAGKWFKESVTPDYAGRIIWDVYYLYGSEAEWGNIPQPLILWGRTIMDKRQELLNQISLLAVGNAQHASYHPSSQEELPCVDTLYWSARCFCSSLL
jgi:hypothetical protein